jgi:uncharacterized membrane protein YfcA
VLILILAGFFIALLSAGLGIGGGVFTVPLLLYTGKLEIFPDQYIGQMAVANSLVTAFFLSLSGTFHNLRKNQIALRSGSLLIAGNVTGAVAGSLWGSSLKSSQLIFLFSLFILGNGLYTLVRFLLKKRKKNDKTSSIMKHQEIIGSEHNLHKNWFIKNQIFTMPFFGIFIGFFSSIIGVGGGLFMVPIFMYIYKLDVHTSIATSTFGIVFTALGGIAGYSFMIHNSIQGMPGPSFGFLYFPYLIPLLLGAVIGGYAGSRVSMKMKPKSLEMIYGSLQLSIGIKMIFDMWYS